MPGTARIASIETAAQSSVAPDVPAKPSHPRGAARERDTCLEQVLKHDRGLPLRGMRIAIGGNVPQARPRPAPARPPPRPRPRPRRRAPTRPRAPAGRAQGGVGGGRTQGRPP
jgi:hypothetical protein